MYNKNMINKEMLDGALTILNKLNNCGYEAYIVGGFVRDYLLNGNSHDIDITTSALPSTVSRLFPNSFNKSDKFKTVTVRVNEFEYEVTTFRVDLKYSDHRHPKTMAASSLKDDIKRRDFTINSMCFDKDLKLVDLENGKVDLDNKLIRCIGNPIKRFNEDALRMFRAFRFASRLNFNIEEKTYKAISKLCYHSKFISKERIKDELSKMITEPYFKNYIGDIIESNILCFNKDIEKVLIILKDNYIPINFTELLTLASFLKGNLVTSLILSKKEIKDIVTINYYINSMIERKISYHVLFDLDYNSLTSAFTILSILRMDNTYKIDELVKFYESLPIKSEKELDITGNDIKKALNIDDSPLIKEYKDYLIKECVNNKVINERSALIKHLSNYGK